MEALGCMDRSTWRHELYVEIFLFVFFARPHCFCCCFDVRSDGAGQKHLNCMFSKEGVKAQHEGAAASEEGAFSNVVMQVRARLGCLCVYA